jgi:hypothetical protein
MPPLVPSERKFARCGHEQLGKALPPIIMAVAMVAAFGLTMFLTVWYSPGCKSSRQSISIGSVVLLAGCGDAR